MNDTSAGAEPDLDFSVVIGCFQEEKSIDEFHDRLSRSLKSLGRSFEIIYVNDGSTDKTFEHLEAVYERDSDVAAIVDLFKNAGQSNAKTPGVLLARGRALVFIDSDLQLDPEELPALVETYEQGYDVVSGYRRNRKDAWTRKLPSKIANMVMRKATHSRIRDFGCTYKIYNARLVRAFDFGPFNPWRMAPVIAMARRIAEVPVTHHPRRYGKSGWTFRKLFAYNMDNIVNLSDRPFQMLAVGCALLALLFTLRVLIAWVFPFRVLSSVSTGLLLNVLVVNMLVLLAVLSAIGEFVIRNFRALQRRPAYVVRTIRVRHADAERVKAQV